MNFEVRLLQQASKFKPKSMTNRMFFGTSVLIGFWKGFGRGLGGQNPRFSHFFRCFFDANFRVQLGKAKNRNKRPKKFLVCDFGVAAAVCAALGGRIIGWGEGKFGLNFKPGLKIGL